MTLRASVLLLLAAALVPSIHAENKDDVVVEHVYPLSTFTLQPPYIDDNLNNRWWNFGGDAMMEVNQYVRLTQDKQSQDGWLWSRVPFTSASWVCEFEFRVHGRTSGLYGDGFAFWYTTEKETMGPVFGSRDEFSGLGIFFDTYANGHHRESFPYISAMVGDGKTKYDHGNDGIPNQVGGCSSNFRDKDYITKAKVKYVQNQMLQLQINVRGDDSWEDCFIAENVTLPTMGYLGFSAWTGDVSDNHDIIRVLTHGITNPHVEHAKPHTESSYQKSHESNSSGGWKTWSIAVVLMVIGLIVGGVWYAQRAQERSYKRF